MERVFIVDVSNGSYNGLSEVNMHLENGWKVKMMRMNSDIIFGSISSRIVFVLEHE